MSVQGMRVGVGGAPVFGRDGWCRSSCWRCWLALLGGFHAPTAQASSSPTTPIWSTQLDFDNNGTAWSESFFAGLAADGLTTAELNMPWGTIEPAAGTFSFTEWDQELANASAAGIQLIPIFWQAGWGGSPAPWINDFEVGSGGAQGRRPTWWDPTEQSEYFTYVTDTIQNSVNQPGGYGGAILDYGYLDAQWDLNGAGGGYAADDISEFQNTYLPQTYGTIATFNSDNGTSYSAFSQVPAAAPGQALFGVFQAFRAWSVQADLRAAHRRRPQRHRQHPAVLLLRRRLRQRDVLRQQPGHVLPARQAVQRHRSSTTTPRPRG